MWALCCRASWLLLLCCFCQVRGAQPQAQDHPGFAVLASASHYWPLEDVDGIQELKDRTGDLMEAKVNKSIYLREEKGVTLLFYNSTSCISSPERCSVEGVTFSFFWKTQGEHARPAPSAYGGQVLSDGFKVCSSGSQGSVQLYTRGDFTTWEAAFSPLGPYWTHILFTWKSKEGLKVYVNGTLSTSDPRGKVSHDYGEPNANLVIGSDQDQTKCYEDGAFDEFIFWERALTPEEIRMYFSAAVGKHGLLSSTPPSFMTLMESTVVPTNAYLPIITNLTEERWSVPPARTALSYLQNMSLSLPNKPLSEETALNLTETFLWAMGQVLLLPSWTVVSEDMFLVPGLIDTIDTVMAHVSFNLQGGGPQVTLVGSSPMADFSLAKLLPGVLSTAHYRFPAHGDTYIEIPGQALHGQAWTTVVGLLYYSVHHYVSNIPLASTAIPPEVSCIDGLLSAASPLISLEMHPPPSLSQNLSGSPLVTVHLRHRLTSKQNIDATNGSHHVFLHCAFLDFSSGQGVWSSQGCARVEGNLSYSVCRCTHLTNFAILMQVVPLELPRGHQVALSSISYIGCALSVLCLAATLVTFAVLSSVSTIRNQRYHIHANLSCAVLVAQVLLLISFHVEPGTVPCQVLATLLHYFFLSAFAWMLVEGLHLYSLVIKVFGSEGSKHLYYYGIGWGLPLVICIISVSFAMDSYGTSDNCWLSLGTGAIWAFVGPALLVIVVNIGILIAVTRVISHISADSYKIHGDPGAFKLTAKAVAVLLPILGTSWAFGVLAVNDQALVFQYMFAVLNSLQGGFIFLFHCLLNSEVRAAFKHKTKVWSLTSSSARTMAGKPFSSDTMNGTRPATASARLGPWDKSSHSTQRVDLSTV